MVCRVSKQGCVHLQAMIPGTAVLHSFWYCLQPSYREFVNSALFSSKVRYDRYATAACPQLAVTQAIARTIRQQQSFEEKRESRQQRQEGKTTKCNEVNIKKCGVDAKEAHSSPRMASAGAGRDDGNFCVGVGVRGCVQLNSSSGAEAATELPLAVSVEQSSNGQSILLLSIHATLSCDNQSRERERT